VCFAGAIGIEPVFFAYAYSVTDPARYPCTTALLYSASHGGNMLGSAVGHLLVDATAVSSHLGVLFVISWVNVSFALVAFVCLLPSKDPPVSTSALTKNWKPTSALGLESHLEGRPTARSVLRVSAG
jgi:hypothetical protein